ncbi:Hypothetical protein A7982_06046 [Minicystis rosea]|nr:Hypothetical protein A7982_06046 [Minicystis rosea]
MRIPLCRHALLSLALLALGAGCGANRDATEKELAELRAEVTRLRAGQSALTERVDGLEIERGTFAKGAASAAPSAPPPPAGGGDRPELSVVRLSPSEGDGDADSDAPRPMVRATGDGGSIQKGAPGKAKDGRTNPKKGATKKDGPTVKP